MADPVTAAATAPAKGAKGLAAFAKQKPAVVVALVGAVGVGAYFIRQRENAANAVDGDALPELDYSGASTPDTYTGGGDMPVYPGSSQGAYYGSDSPAGASQDPYDPSTNPWAAVLAWYQENSVPVWSGALTGGGAPGSPSGVHVDPEGGPVYAPPEVSAPAPITGSAPPVVIASKPQPVSITIAGKTFANGVSSSYLGSGSNSNGKYGKHRVHFKDGHNEVWWHYVSGKYDGRWTGPHSG